MDNPNGAGITNGARWAKLRNRNPVDCVFWQPKTTGARAAVAHAKIAELTGVRVA
jgi:hypothetical protein